MPWISPTVNEIGHARFLSRTCLRLWQSLGAWNLYHSQGGGVQGSLSCRTEAGMEPACIDGKFTGIIKGLAWVNPA